MSEIILLKPKKEKLKIGIICAARMMSKRFPGKSMTLLFNKPLIQWTLERARQIRGPKGSLTKVVLAVPDTVDSEPMLQLVDKLKITNFCGSHLNVLKRYYDCANFFKFDIVMRITCDCPFIDPVVCSQVLQLLIWRKLDYASNVFPKRSYQMGLDCEAFTFDALEAAYKLADQLGDYEHVTPWLQRTEGVNRGNVVQKIDQSKVNWCIDYPTDIERLENLIKKDAKILIGANDDNPAT